MSGGRGPGGRLEPGNEDQNLQIEDAFYSFPDCRVCFPEGLWPFKSRVVDVQITQPRKVC